MINAIVLVAVTSSQTSTYSLTISVLFRLPGRYITAAEAQDTIGGLVPVAILCAFAIVCKLEQTRDRYVAVTSGSVIALTDQVVLVVRRAVFRISV